MNYSRLLDDLRDTTTDRSGRGNSDLMREAAKAIAELIQGQRKRRRAKQNLPKKLT